MANVGLHQLDAFDVNAEGGRNNSVRWKKWLRRLDNYLEAASIENDRKKITTLLHVAGEHVLDIYEAKRNTGTQRAEEKYDDIVKLLNEYFEPQKNVDMNVLIFRQASQRAGESIDKFYVRLKGLASDCEFADDTEEQIKLQILSTCIDKRIRVKAAQEKMDLASVLKFGQALEHGAEAANGFATVKKEYGATLRAHIKWLNRIDT